MSLFAPVEHALAKGLRLHYVLHNSFCDRPTKDEARSILKNSGYLDLDLQRDWFDKLVFVIALKTINWERVIDKAMSQEVFREVAADLIKRHNVRL